MRIFFIGDIYSSPGRTVLRDHLNDIVQTRSIDLVIANGENAAGGFGLTPAIAEDLFTLGIDVITTGNHIWDKREILPYLESGEKAPQGLARRVLRPANLPGSHPGFGVFCGQTRGGEPYAVVNLQGRVFMTPIDCPFQKADELLAGIPAECRTIFVDFHAEATSEKQAMGWYLDGRVTAVVGTHTHVPTADERILSGGTAFQTDTGMTGAYAGVIGSRIDEVLLRMKKAYPARLEPASGDVRLCGVIVDATGGRATQIERFCLRKTD